MRLMHLLAAVGGPGFDSRDDDATRFYGVPGLSKSSLGFSVIAIPSAGEQARLEAGV